MSYPSVLYVYFARLSCPSALTVWPARFDAIPIRAPYYHKCLLIGALSRKLTCIRATNKRLRRVPSSIRHAFRCFCLFHTSNTTLTPYKVRVTTWDMNCRVLRETGFDICKPKCELKRLGIRFITCIRRLSHWRKYLYNHHHHCRNYIIAFTFNRDDLHHNNCNLNP